MIKPALVYFQKSATDFEEEKVSVDCPYCGHCHQGEWVGEMIEKRQKRLDRACKCGQVFQAVNYYTAFAC